MTIINDHHAHHRCHRYHHNDHHDHHCWHHYHPYDHDSCSMWTGREQCARVDSHMDLFNLSLGGFVIFRIWYFHMDLFTRWVRISDFVFAHLHLVLRHIDLSNLSVGEFVFLVFGIWKSSMEYEHVHCLTAANLNIIFSEIFNFNFN